MRQPSRPVCLDCWCCIKRKSSTIKAWKKRLKSKKVRRHYKKNQDN